MGKKCTPPQKLSAASIKSLVGKTWFDLEEKDSQIILDTRAHGDVGTEMPGKADLAEARRMAEELRKALPRHEVRVESVDEWVVLSVSRNEKSKEHLAREEKMKLAQELKGEWVPHIEAVLSKITQKCLGTSSQSKNHIPPFSWSSTVSLGEKTWTTTFSAEYGERYLYRDHQRAIPAFKTTAEILPHLSELAKCLGGTVTAQCVNKPWKKLTYNRPSPNNVIEEVGHVTFHLELPLAPPPQRGLGEGRSISKPTLARPAVIKAPQVK